MKFVLYESVPWEFFETARNVAKSREELENKVLEGFKNGEIDKKNYDIFISILNETEYIPSDIEN